MIGAVMLFISGVLFMTFSGTNEFRIQFNVDTDKTLTEGLWINEDSLIVP